MRTVLIEENSPQAKQLLEYIKTLPFATVVEEKKQTFEEACAECNAVSAEVFIDGLKERVTKLYRNAKS